MRVWSAPKTCAVRPRTQGGYRMSEGEMMLPNIVNSIGLACDIVGVILLFFCGLPSKVNRGGHTLVSALSLGKTPEGVKRWKRFERLSWLALVLLVLGFVLQIVSNHL